LKLFFSFPSTAKSTSPTHHTPTRDAPNAERLGIARRVVRNNLFPRTERTRERTRDYVRSFVETEFDF
jgi:hypothetical protein